MYPFRWTRAFAVCVGCIAAAILPVPQFVSRSMGEDGLPLARELADNAAQLLAAGEEGQYWPRLHLAKAYVYLHDPAAARRVLMPYEDDVWVPIAYMEAAALQVELTGAETILPAVLWRNNADMAHWCLAEGYAKRGDVGMALKQLREIPPNTLNPLHGLGQKLVVVLESKGESDACKQVLIRWADCYAASSSPSQLSRAKMEWLVGWLLKFGERDKAIELCDRWQRALAGQSDIREYGDSIALSWAKLGRSLAILGENDRANDALQQASKWLEAVRAAQFDATRDMHYIDYAGAYAALAARQEQVLGPEAAAGAYQTAYDYALHLVPTLYRHHGYLKIVQAQLEADDEPAARRTMERIPAVPDRARCWRETISHFVERGRIDDARQAARLAAQEFDHAGIEASNLGDFYRVAVAAGQADEVEAARRLLSPAISIAKSDSSDAPSQLVELARMQTSAGLFADAYRTIKRIPDAEGRAARLADLALESAKAEHAVAKQR